MQVENHKEEVPFEYYLEKFAALDAGEAAARLKVPFENGKFSLKLLGEEYTVSHPDYAIEGSGFAAKALPPQTFLLRCLLEGKAVESTNEFKAFREMPWGELYIQPFTGRVLTRAAFTFGTRIQKFREAAEKLGGLPLKHGDAGYEFEFMGNYRLRMLIWEGDDEFPPSAQLLYSANFEDGFSAEDRVVAGDLLIGALKAKM